MQTDLCLLTPLTTKGLLFLPSDWYEACEHSARLGVQEEKKKWPEQLRLASVGAPAKPHFLAPLAPSVQTESDASAEPEAGASGSTVARQRQVLQQPESWHSWLRHAGCLGTLGWTCANKSGLLNPVEALCSAGKPDGCSVRRVRRSPGWQRERSSM